MADHRFTDDLGFRAPDDPAPIHFVGALRRHLGILDASHDDAAKAIRNWLQTVEPSKSLIRDLEQSEFAEVLGRGSGLTFPCG